MERKLNSSTGCASLERVELHGTYGFNKES